MSKAAIAAFSFVAWLVMKQVASASTSIAPEKLLPIINRVNAEEFNGWFDPLDVLAIISIESSFRPGAFRYESHLDDASIGLMQVLSSTARDRGYDGPVNGLFDPEVSIVMGMRHLKWGHDFLAQRMGGGVPKDTWIGAYNAGVGNALKGYTPLQYVGKFKATRARLG